MILSHLVAAALAAWLAPSFGWPGVAVSLTAAAAIGVVLAVATRRRFEAPLRSALEDAARAKASSAAADSRSAETSAVLGCVTDALLAIDADDRITYANAEALRLFDVDAVGERPQYWEVVRDATLQDLLTTAWSTAAPVEGTMKLAHVAPRRDLEVRIVPRGTATSPWSGAVLAFRDVTRIHRLEAVRRDFVANVSHEMKTPLTSILGYVETLLGGALEDAETARGFLAKIERNARNLGHLVTDLLVLSRVEAGGLAMEEEPFPLAQVVGEAVGACAEKAREKGIALRNDPADREVLVRGDHDLLVRAIVNLLDNAIQHTPAGGRVVVASKASGDDVEVAIADTGIGIAAHELDRIFERFYRVDKARSRVLGGTGLGLAIVKHVAERHGGTVRVASREGVGSTFTLTLPAAAQA